MKVNELMEILQSLDHNAEIITSFWNGFAETYTMVDTIRSANLDSIRNDFFGTPGVIDYDVPQSGAEKIFFVGSSFPMKDKRVYQARRALWCIISIFDMHRSLAWKKEQICKRLKRYMELVDEDN